MAPSYVQRSQQHSQHSHTQILGVYGPLQSRQHLATARILNICTKPALSHRCHQPCILITSLQFWIAILIKFGSVEQTDYLAVESWLISQKQAEHVLYIQIRQVGDRQALTDSVTRPSRLGLTAQWTLFSPTMIHCQDGQTPRKTTVHM